MLRVPTIAKLLATFVPTIIKIKDNVVVKGLCLMLSDLKFLTDIIFEYRPAKTINLQIGGANFLQKFLRSFKIGCENVLETLSIL